MRVLIVKVSSLGDVIHTLPAVTDACRAKKGLTFDWVVEEDFQEVPAWHPGVNKVIPVAFRRWRKNIFRTWKSGEFSQFKKNLKEEHYDLVIDAQGLIKSGVISRLAKGLTVGLSNRTIREPLATLFYNVVYAVPWQQHAVERVRDLFSRTFNYGLDNRPCDYGIDKNIFLTEDEQNQELEKNLVFLHGTTWVTKKWPDSYWEKLARLATKHGYKVKIFWENDEELERARLIAGSADNIEILGSHSLNDIAKILVKANAVVAIDTGLAHLAAVLNVPVVSIYGATNPELTGVYGDNQIILKSLLKCSPCLKKECEYEANDSAVTPFCYADNPPEKVWKSVKALLAESQQENLHDQTENKA